MIRNNKVRLFGPLKSNVSHLDAPYSQRGEGIASFFTGLFKKAIPFASKAIKSLASSNIVKDTTKQLTKHAKSSIGDIVADVIQGKDPINSAKENLQKARQEIAQTIRTNTRSKNENKRMKRKKLPVKTVSKGKRRKYNLFNDYEAQ